MAVCSVQPALRESREFPPYFAGYRIGDLFCFAWRMVRDVVLLWVPSSPAGAGSSKLTVMAIESSQRLLAIFVALSIPPVAMLFMALRRSKRSDENIPAAHDHDRSSRAQTSCQAQLLARRQSNPTSFVRFEQWVSIKAPCSPRMNLLAPVVSLLIVAAKLRPAPATFVATYTGAGVIMTVRPQLSASQPRQCSSNARSACLKRYAVSIPSAGRIAHPRQADSIMRRFTSLYFSLRAVTNSRRTAVAS